MWWLPSMGLSFQATLACDNCSNTAACPIACGPTGLLAYGVIEPDSTVIVGEASYPTGWKAGLRMVGGVMVPALFCQVCAPSQPQPPVPSNARKTASGDPNSGQPVYSSGPQSDPLFPPQAPTGPASTGPSHSQPTSVSQPSGSATGPTGPSQVTGAATGATGPAQPTGLSQSTGATGP